MPTLQVISIAFAVVFVLIQIVVFAPLVRTWFKAFLSGVPVPLPVILMMKLRGNPPSLLVDALIMLKHQGVPASIADIERTYIAHRSRIAASDDLVEQIKQNEKRK